jgi:hypothetical protein
MTNIKQNQNRIINTIDDNGSIFIKIDSYVLSNIKMKSKWKENTWLPIMDAYLFVYEELIEKLDFIVSKVNEGKVKKMEINEIADTSFVGYGKSYKERLKA